MPKVNLDIVTDFTPLERVGTHMDHLGKEASQLSHDMTTAFRMATREADKFDKEINDGARDLARMENTGKRTIPQVANGFRNVSNEVKNTKKEMSGLESKMGDIATGITAAFSVGAIISFGKKILDTRAEFQKFEAVLTNTLGSKSLAASAMTMIQDVASKTPFSVAELTESFVKLANQGFEPTAAEITKLGDLAASQGKSFDQLTEAIIDAQTGEFERLKEFGVKASKSGDQVTFTFKGVKTTVKNTGDEINKYILSLGELKGVSGGMAAISETLGGKVSNLGDNFDALFNNLGKQSESGFGGFLDTFNELLGKTNEMSTNMLRVNDALKGTGAELGFTEKRGTEIARLVAFQTEVIDKVAAFGQKAKTAQEFVPIYKTYNTILQQIRAEYEQGKIDVAEYSRRILLVKQAVATLNDQKQHAADQAEKAADRANQKTKEQLEAEKKAAEAIKKAREDLAKALEALQKRADKAALDSLAGEARINRERELAQKEIDELKAEIIKKRIAAHQGNKLTESDNELFRQIELAADREQAEKLLKIQVDLANALAKQRKKDADDRLASAQTKTQLQTAKVEGFQKPDKMDEVTFEQAKQRMLLNIQKAAQIEQLDLKEEQLQAEADAQIKAIENELALLRDRDDAEAKLKREQGAKNIAVIKQNLDDQTDLVQQETMNAVKAIDKELDGLNKKKKFDIAKWLGLSDEQMKQLMDGLGQLEQQLQGLAQAQIQSQQQTLDEEIRINEERQAQRDNNISNLQDQLNKELDLQRQGLANNVDAIRAQIAAEQAAKAAAVEQERKLQQEKKKLAKEQFILDSIMQGQSLISASASLYKGLSPFVVGPVPVGAIIASATIAAMFGSFIAAKSKALQLQNSQPGFRTGGYTGDKGVDEIAGHVHGREFVNTAEDTKLYRELFEGIHVKDKQLINRGILKLLENTGVVLPADLPKSLSHNINFVKTTEARETFRQDNTGMERRMDAMYSKVSGILKETQTKITVMPDGTVIQKFGNITRTIKPKR
jgi:hypothetical protein